jgi:hypothetical protein
MDSLRIAWLTKCFGLDYRRMAAALESQLLDYVLAEWVVVGLRMEYWALETRVVH